MVTLSREKFGKPLPTCVVNRKSHWVSRASDSHFLFLCS